MWSDEPSLRGSWSPLVSAAGKRKSAENSAGWKIFLLYHNYEIQIIDNFLSKFLLIIKILSYHNFDFYLNKNVYLIFIIIYYFTFSLNFDLIKQFRLLIKCLL